jgi:pyruvate oxidase
MTSQIISKTVFSIIPWGKLHSEKRKCILLKGGNGVIPMLTAGAFIVEQLQAWGVKRVYGVIGDANLFLLNELSKQTEVKYIPCVHECGAALMASAEAKLTGRVGVCVATSGPGTANLLNGLADAALDQAPILAITGQVASSKFGTLTKQYINQQFLMAGITEQSELVIHPDTLPEMMLRSLTQASVYGKVTHIAVPKDLYDKQVKGSVTPYPAHLHPKCQTEKNAVARAAEMMAAASRPVFYVGRGAQQADSQILSLAEVLEAALISTMPARNIFPNDHRLFAGGIGPAGSAAAYTLLSESDLIVMMGATWWPEQYVPSDTSIIQIDSNPMQIGINHKVDLGIAVDLKDVVPQLLQQLGERSASSKEWKARIAALKENWVKRITTECEAEDSATPIPPAAIMKILSDEIDADAVIAVDTGDHTLWFNRIFQVKQQEILISGRWRTLGFAIPAAIAAQLIQPDRQVIAIAGDGGVVQTIMEFQTAAKLELPIKVIVLNNSCYAMEKNRMEAAGFNTMGSELVNPDFSLLAQACGGIGLKARTVKELKSQLDKALKHPGPVMIDVSTADTKVPHTN